MYKAKLTKRGAERIGRPELAGKEVEYESIHKLGLCVNEVYYNGERIAGSRSFLGSDASLELITRPEDKQNENG